MKLLFIGALPDPITGQSLACQVFLDELRRVCTVDVINLSKREFKQGVSSIGRVLEVICILHRAWRLRNSSDLIYFTISESFAGNLKDICIYLLCYRQLPRMYVHLHGGAGLRKILLGRPGWLRRLNEFCLRRMAGVIVLGGRHVDMFTPSVEQQRIHIVPNFAQEYLFSDPEAIIRKFSDTNPLRILFLSNLIPGKGYLELLEAVLAMGEDLQQRLRLDFAGGFESPEQQQQFTARIAKNPRISYHGVVRGDQKRELLTRAHVFCLPTYYPYEGQPISILEAYAAGCVVVTTDHSGIFDIFTPGKQGYVVGKRSVADLVEVLTRMLHDPASLRDKALNNFRLAERDFKPAKYIRNLLTALQLPMVPQPIDIGADE